MPETDLRLRVDGLLREADQVISVTLADPSGRKLPDWAPGSHIQLRLPSGRTRQYSLFAGGKNGTQYKIAVKNVDDGRGGSYEVHSKLKLGDLLDVSAPANNFPLETGENFIFVAGGIGITPILPMVEAIRNSDAWRLYYAGRSLSSMALIDSVDRLPKDQVTIAPSPERRLDLAQIVKDAKPQTVVYACGPHRMLDELVQLCAERGDITLRIERFSAPASAQPVDTSNDKSFEVILKRSGRRVTIPPDSNILAELLNFDPSVKFSCCEGYCGTCETKVLEGIVDHRDSLLTADERERNHTMMICVSRARSDVLLLDL